MAADSRLEGNLLSGHSTTFDGERVMAKCNMVSLTPFTKPKTKSTTQKQDARFGYESALAKILAIQHLNDGDGSLIPEIEGLDQTCSVTFGVDFVNTQLSIGQSTIGLARRLADTDAPPCVFLGSYRSIVSSTTSKLLLAATPGGYPQISGTSTSSLLDDADKYPLFSRTTPSNKGHSEAIIRYLREELDVHHLTLIYIADPYGYHYFQDLREAAAATADGFDNDFQLEAFSLLPDLSNLSEAMEFVRSTRFRYVFAAIYGEYLNDHTLMEAAIAHGVAGSNNTINSNATSTTWLFGDDFLTAPNDLVFDASDPLVDAYRGTGMLTANGRGSLKNPDGRYREFVKQLRDLRDETVNKNNNIDDDDEAKNVTNTLLEDYLETMVADEENKDLAIEFLDELVADDTFLHPELLNYAIPYEYESVIMAGLAVCNSVGKQQQQILLDGEGDDDGDGDGVYGAALFVDGEGFQQELVHTVIDGISGKVALDHLTGTRLQNSAYYTIQNLVAEDFEEYFEGGEVDDDNEPIQKTRFWKKKTAQLEPIIISGDENDKINEPIIIGGDENDENDESNDPIIIGWDENDETNGNNSHDRGGWVTLDKYVYNDGGTTAHSDVVPSFISIPTTIQPRLESSIDDVEIVNIALRTAQGIFCGLPILAAIGCLIWTYYYRNRPIVRASKPLFLYLICCGVILFASANLPFSILGNGEAFNEDGEANFVRTMNIVCTASIWLRSIGFAVIISALFAKTYRINKFIRGTKLYRMSRAMMWVDFFVPLAVILAINILILSLMTVLDPVTYGIADIQPSYDIVYESSCVFTEDHRLHFWIPLVCWNVSVLAFALYQSWSVRNFDLELSTRFPCEGPQIFNALLSSLLVSLVGIAVMLIVRDNGNPTIIALAEGVIVFVFCVLVLWSIFGTKAKHVWKTTSRQHDTTDTDDSRIQGRMNHSLATQSRTKEELKVENDGLRKRNIDLEEELILYPTTGRSVNKILKNFFGKLLGSEDGFDEYTQAPSVDMSIEHKHKKKEQQQQQQPSTDAAKPASFTLRCKKIIQDICVYPSDLFLIFPSGIRIDPTDHPSDLFQSFPTGIRINPTQHRRFYLKSTTSTSNNRNDFNNDININTENKNSSSTPTTQSDLTDHRRSDHMRYSSNDKNRYDSNNNNANANSSPRNKGLRSTPTMQRRNSSGSKGLRSTPTMQRRNSSGSKGLGSTPTTQRKNTSNENSSSNSKNKSSPESNNNNTQTNKSSPESNKTHNTRTKKSSPESSTPTTQSDLRPQKSSYYSSPTKRKPSRGPEPEDESTIPLDNKRRSFDSTAVDSTVVLISPELARSIFRPQSQPPTPLTSPASLHYLMGGGVTSSPRNMGSHHMRENTGSSSHHMREIPEGIPRNVLVYPTTDWLQSPEQQQQQQQQEQEQQQNSQQQQQRSPTGPRRPSLGFDVDIQPDLRTEYRHIV